MLKQFVILTLVVGGCLRAQTVIATVPFRFQAGSVERPPGEYLMTCAGRFLFVRPVSPQVAPEAVLPSFPDQRDRHASNDAAVRFVRSGDRYLLSKLWGREGLGCSVPARWAEKNFRLLPPRQGADLRAKDGRKDEVHQQSIGGSQGEQPQTRK